MLTLADYTSPELIQPQLRSQGTAAVLAELCSSLDRCGRVPDLLAFYNGVVSRERLSSTATPPGWALPHARLQSTGQLSFALGRSATPLDWLEAGKPEVRLVFLFAVPENQASDYVRVLAALAKLSEDVRLRQSLLEVPDRASLFKLLEQVPLPQPNPTARRTRSRKAEASLLS